MLNASARQQDTISKFKRTLLLMKKWIQNKRPQDNPGTSLKKENTYNIKKGRVKWKTLTTRKEALWGYYLW